MVHGSLFGRRTLHRPIGGRWQAVAARSKTVPILYLRGLCEVQGGDFSETASVQGARARFGYDLYFESHRIPNLLDSTKKVRALLDINSAFVVAFVVCVYSTDREPEITRMKNKTQMKPIPTQAQRPSSTSPPQPHAWYSDSNKRVVVVVINLIQKNVFLHLAIFVASLELLRRSVFVQHFSECRHFHFGVLRLPLLDL